MVWKRGDTSLPPEEMEGLPARVDWHVMMSREFHELTWRCAEADGFDTLTGFVRDCIAERIEQVLHIEKETALALSKGRGHKYWLQRQQMLRKADGTFGKKDDDLAGDLP